MKKILQGLVCAGLCAVLAVGATGCSKSAHRDSEKDAFKLAIGAVDQKFNPLFYTAQNDGEIANMTQVSMLSIDYDGNLAYGDDYPTVTLDYKETYYDAAGVQIGTGTGDGKVTGESSVNGSTVYEFVLKNGMMYSDGVHPLTIMDVLFNLYVYLDPVYMGSSTMYSTKIKGLQKYRLQDPYADSDATSSTSEYYSAALNRINALIDWADALNPDEDSLSDEEKEDLAAVRKYYLEELTSDYNSVETGWEESYKEYKFEAAWQVFYYIEGLVSKQTEQTTDGQGHNTGEQDLRDSADGKYLTDFDPKGSETPAAQHLIDDMEDYVEANFSSYKANHPDLTDDEVTAALQRENAIANIYDNYSVNAEIDYVLTYCATRSTALDYFMADEMSKDLAANKVNGQLAVPRIEGITAYKTNTFNGTTYSESHDVLRIEIEGVDPKAKWNFSFSVAPMYYYSDTAHYEAAKAAYEDGTVYTEYGANGAVTKAATCTDFGVEYGDITWFNSVIGADAKTALPMGAGAYKATSNSAYRNKTEAGSFDGGDFFYNNVAYFERNEQFTTMGKNVENAKIKYITYEVLSDDKIVSALKTGKIDYGTPNATSDNQKAVQTGSLKQTTYQTGGYGYVGINPQAVPDLEVRQAIMHCFNLSSVTNYYGSKALVSLIYRPMSTTSWAYPTGATAYYEQKTDNAADIQFIQDLVKSSGNWELNSSGKFVSTEDSSKKLKLTFTIAGDTTDHPSYQMFKEAETLLEKCGFDISVETDIQALQKLASGKLEVWAAAWSSSIDPDPYQIYSINSTASSTKNWYKDGIMNDATGRFWREQAIAEVLSDKIDAGRQTLSQDERKAIYSGSPETKANSDYTNLENLSCLNLIMELAVEFPTYQRNDLCVWNSSVLDESSLNIKKASLYISPIGEIWKVAFKK